MNAYTLTGRAVTLDDGRIVDVREGRYSHDDRERYAQQMQRFGIPIGSDDPGAQAMGAPPLRPVTGNPMLPPAEFEMLTTTCETCGASITDGDHDGAASWFCPDCIGGKPLIEVRRRDLVESTIETADVWKIVLLGTYTADVLPVVETDTGQSPKLWRRRAHILVVKTADGGRTCELWDVDGVAHTLPGLDAKPGQSVLVFTPHEVTL